MTEERPASPQDRYAHLLWVQRRRCLLITHADTLFSVFAPNVRAVTSSLGGFVAPLIVAQLITEGFPATTLGTLDPARQDRRQAGTRLHE